MVTWETDPWAQLEVLVTVHTQSQSSWYSNEAPHSWLSFSLEFGGGELIAELYWLVIILDWQLGPHSDHPDTLCTYIAVLSTSAWLTLDYNLQPVL